MIQHIPADQRIFRNFGWLEARWLFSFGDHHDPDNLNWGALRVFNDDVIHPGGGFDEHPHRDMEIVTVVWDGTLEHRDSLGHVQQLKPGGVQVMSAGSGIRHAEYNASSTDPLRVTQIWIMPHRRRTAPRWDQRDFDPADRRNRWHTVVTQGGDADTLGIGATLALTALDAGRTLPGDSAAGRFSFLYVVHGTVALNGRTLGPGDQARLRDEPSWTLEAATDADLIRLDLPPAPGPQSM